MPTYGALHLLIKFQGSRNPVSRRTNQSTENVTAEMAIAELKEYEAKIKVRRGAAAAAASCAESGGANARAAPFQPASSLTRLGRRTRAQEEGVTAEVFKKYAAARSDCGSCKQGGDLGEFGPGEMQKQFEDGVK